MFSISSILWPSDGSEHSQVALEAAIKIAEKFQAKLFGLRVVQAVPIVVGSGFAPDTIHGFDVPMYEQELVNNAKRELQYATQNKIPDSLESTLQVEIGIPADMINEFAEKNNIDLIVMATQGRTGFSHLMMGSVAEKTLRHSERPVLVVPAKVGAES